MEHKWTAASTSHNNEAGIRKPTLWGACTVPDEEGMNSQQRASLPSLATNLRGKKEQVTEPLGKGLASSPGNESSNACPPPHNG